MHWTWLIIKTQIPLLLSYSYKAREKKENRDYLFDMVSAKFCLFHRLFKLCWYVLNSILNVVHYELPIDNFCLMALVPCNEHCFN